MAAAARIWRVEPSFFGAPRAPRARLEAREAERFVLDYYTRRPLPPGFTFYEMDELRPAVIWRGAVGHENAAIGPGGGGAAGEPDEAVADCVGQLVAGGADLWDGEILALRGADADGVRFSRESFFTYRLTTGLLGEEAARGETRLRDRLMPAMDGFGARLTGGGLQATVAVARPAPYDDFAIPLQVRSGRVSDGRGLHGVVPMAYHQAMANGDARPVMSAWREIHEELFGEPETEDDRFIAHPGVARLREAAHVELTGLSLNLVNGNYDFNLLVCVREPDYWEQYARGWTQSWEAARVFWLSTRDSGTFHRLLRQGAWVPQSLVSLHEGWKRLRAIAPGRF